MSGGGNCPVCGGEMVEVTQQRRKGPTDKDGFEEVSTGVFVCRDGASHPKR